MADLDSGQQIVNIFPVSKTHLTSFTLPTSNLGYWSGTPERSLAEWLRDLGVPT